MGSGNSGLKLKPQIRLRSSKKTNANNSEYSKTKKELSRETTRRRGDAAMRRGKNG
jgi:hypothetical protein